MEVHTVTLVEDKETTVYHGEPVEYTAKCYYCNKADIYYETEEQMMQNYKAMTRACSLKC